MTLRERVSRLVPAVFSLSAFDERSNMRVELDFLTREVVLTSYYRIRSS